MRSARVLVGAVCLGLLGASAARVLSAAGTKTGGSSPVVTVVDDLSFGNTGSTNLNGGSSPAVSVAGSLGQTAAQTQSGGSAPSVTVDGGYFAFGGVSLKTWAGVAGGAASNPNNWVGGVAPIAGDYIVFGATNPNNSCTWDLNIAIGSMTVYAAYTSSITLTTDLDAGAGINALAGPSATLDLKGHKLSLSGDLTARNNWNQISTVAGATVAFYGSGDSNAHGDPSGTVLLNFPALVINKNAGSKVIMDGNYLVNGDFVLNTGTFTPATMGWNTFYLKGNYNQTGGHFDRGLSGVVSTLYMTGSSPQTMAAGGGTRAQIDNFYVLNNSTLTLAGSFAFGGFTSTQPATTLIFPTAQTVTMNSATINGQAAGTRELLKSDSSGLQAALNVAAGGANVSYALVKDVNSAGGGAITANNSVDGGDNLNWTFPGGGGGVPTQVSLNAISEGHGLVKAPNGFLYAVGYSSSGANGADIWVAKFDTTMHLLSSATFDGSGHGYDNGNAVAVDANSNVFAVGRSSIAGLGEELWVGKLDANLNLQSSGTFNAPFPDNTFNGASGVAVSTFSVGALAAGDVVISGAQNADGTNRKIWLLHLNNNAQFVSSTTFFNGFDQNFANGLALDSLGNLYVTGGVAPAPATSSRVWVGKFNSALVFITSATRTSVGGNSEQATAVAVDPSGTVFVTGFINNAGAVGQAWAAKYASNLAFLQETSFATGGTSYDHGNAVALGNNGDIVLAGDVQKSGGSDHDVWFAELSPSLALVSSATVDGPSVGDDQGFGVAVDTSSNQAFVGGFVTNGANHNAWLGRFGITNSIPVFVSTTAIAPATVGSNQNGVGLMRLGLWTNQGSVSLNSLLVTLLGNAPSGNVTAKLYRDTVGDGVFHSTSDFIVGAQVFAAGAVPQAQLSFSPETVNSTTQYYFLGVDLSSVPFGKTLGAAVDNGSRFGFTNGFMANQPLYPIQSGQPLVQLTLFANPSAGNYPAPTGGAAPTGGFDTGIFLQSGQNVVASGAGSWVNNGAATNANGAGGTGGLGASLVFGSLVGRVGGSAWQQLGTAGSTITATAQGDLFLAMNSTTSASDSGSIAVTAQVLVSTVPRVWLGNSGISQNASVNANWLNGLPPAPGDTVLFQSTGPGLNAQNCNWDLYSANVGLLKLTTSYAGVVTVANAAYQLTVSSHVLLSSGTLALGSGVTLSVLGQVNIQGGTFDMGPGGGVLSMANGGAVNLSSGVFKSLGTTAVTLSAPAASGGFAFNVTGGAMTLNNSGQTKLVNSTGLTVASSALSACGDWPLGGCGGNFAGLAFQNSSLNPSASLVLGAPSPLAKTLAGLSFDINTSTDIDASNLPAGSTITLLNAGGVHMGSPFQKDPNRVLVWSPDGGSQANVTGTLTNAGAGSGGYTILASTVPQGGGASDVSFSTTPGAFTLPPLTAPNTFYFVAWRTPGAFPTGYDPRGGYGYPGILNSVPVFAGSNANISGINITIKDWSVITGTVTNNSSQNGPVVIQAWNGGPGLSTSTLLAVFPSSPMGPGGSFSYSMSVPNTDLTLGATSLFVLGFIDLAHNGMAQAFDASASSSGATAIHGATNPGVSLALSGGSAAPGGTLNVGTVNPFPADPGFIAVGPLGIASAPTGLPTPMIRLDLSAAGSTITLNGLQVDVVGPAPANPYGLAVWRDDVDPGTFDNPAFGGPGPFDTQVAVGQGAAGVSSGTVNFLQPETLLPGTTRTYFVTFDYQGQPSYPAVSLRIGSTSYFSLSQGAPAVQTSTYPILSAAVTPKGTIMASIAANAPSGGGENMNLFVGAGQQLDINILAGTWRINPSSTSTGSGLAGTQGQATVVPAANVGQIIARVGDSLGNGTTWFPVQAGVNFTAGASGNLFFAQNNFVGNYANASGAVFFSPTVPSVIGSTTGVIVGTVTYAGGVSSGGLFLHARTAPPSGCPSCAPGAVVSASTVAMSAGTTQYSYTLSAIPPGPVVIDAVVQNSPAQLGSFPNPVSVAPGSTTTGVNFPMFLGLATISGTANYSGIQSFGNFLLAASTASGSGFPGSIVKAIQISTGAAFSLGNLPSPNTYYLLAFRDVNGDNQPDGPEPVGVDGNSSGPLGSTATFASVFVDTGASVGGQLITILDRGAISGNVNGSGVLSNTQIIVLAGHGTPGTAGFTVETPQRIFVGPPLPANWSLGFNVGLLRPATDYSLVAFIDPDFNGQLDPGELFGQLNGPIIVSSAGVANASLSINPPQPPPPVTGFFGQAQSTTTVLWTWNGVQGAAQYNLRTSSGGLYAVAPGSAFSYLDTTVGTNTFSNITAIQSSNTFGASALASVPPLASLAAVPSAPSFPGVFQSSVTLSWFTNGNSTMTIYQVLRATSATAQYFLAATTGTQNLTTAGFNDGGLVPGTNYFYKIAAANLNGIQAGPGGANNATTTGVGGVPSIAGTVSYGGTEAGGLVIQAFPSAAMTGAPIGQTILPPSAAQSYFINVPAGGGYYVRAFIDVFGTQVFNAAEDSVSSGPVTVAGPVNNFNLTLASDTVAPGPATGLTSQVSFGQVSLSWTAPTIEANGAPLADLAGYRVKRSTVASGPFLAITTGTVFGIPGATAQTFFTDASPVPGAVNFYNIVAVDYEGLAGPPSQTVAVTPNTGGTVAGTLQYGGATAQGPFRVRLSTTPQAGVFAAENDLSSPGAYSFTGLTDGNYFVRAFRDLNGSGAVTDNDPVGTFGGIGQPYPVFILNASSTTNANFPVCDRTVTSFGTSASPVIVSSTTSGGCPASDQGSGFFTSLYDFHVGGGGLGSVGPGSQISIAMQSTFTPHILLLGPDGSLAAQDNPVGSGALTFTVPQQPGTYIIEPTSYQSGLANVGPFSLKLTQTGGFAGLISGSVNYSGAQPGRLVVQIFTSPNPNAVPVTISTFPAPGAYSVGNVPDGTYFVRAFRDSNNDLTADPRDASGVFGVSASSLTAVTIQGGITFVGGAQAAPNSINIQLSDPAVGSISGQVLHQGTIGGTIHIEVGAPPACQGCYIGVVAFSTIPNAGGAFNVPFIAPATNYVVQAYVDQNGNGVLDSLEPAVSTSPISVTANQATSLNFLITDPGSGASGNAQVQGTISYAGTATGTLHIGLATDTSFYNIPYVLTQASTGTYLKSGVVGGTSYYIGAFIDLNNTNALNQGDPVGTYNGGQPLFVPQSGAVTANVTLNDPPNGAISGQVSYSGAAPLYENIVVQAAVPGGATGSGNYTFQKAVIARAAGQSQYGFNLPFLGAATNYSVIAFVDAGGSGVPQPGEPFAFFGQPVCSAGGQCVSSPVSVSSGTGAFATAGTNIQIFDPGGCSGGLCLGSTGGIFGDLTYLGTQSGPIVVRVFTNSSLTGTPLVTVSTFGPAGPGAFKYNITNLALNTTYYLDAFRDPALTGSFNAAFDAYGVLNAGQGVLLTQNAPNQGVSGDKVIDPGTGGSVNTYAGGFGVSAGARFDGGATDIAGAVAVDTASAGAPLVYVAGITSQNSGLLNSLVKYDSNGSKLSSATLPSGVSPKNTINVDYSAQPARVYLSGTLGASGGLYRYDGNLNLLNQVKISAASKVKAVALGGGAVYVGVAADAGTAGRILRKLDPNSFFAAAATGTYNFPSSAQGAVNAAAVAVDTNTGSVYAVASLVNNGANILTALVKFGANLDFSGTPQAADISSLGVPLEGVGLAVDGSGNVFLSFAPQGQGKALTYKFNSSLQQTGSAFYSPILVHLAGNGTNLGLDSNGHVYEAWEAPVNGGDYLVLHYDNNLNLVASQTYDGMNNTLEDFAFGVAVKDSGNVFVTGATNNGLNLDWTTLKLNMNVSGANTAPPPSAAVAVSSAIAGTVRYSGGLMSSGTIRTSLFVLGQTAPLRTSTAAFAASSSYLFNNLQPGFYQVKSFIDAAGAFQPLAGEAVAESSATGIAFVGGVVTQNLILCDRRPIAVGVPLFDTITPADCPAPDRGGAFQRLYTFAGQAGQAVNIENDALNFFDSAFNLYDPNGALVASGSDQYPDANARLVNFALPSNGLYTIGASPFAAGLSSATFKLSLANSAGSPGSISGNAAYTGAQGGAFTAALFSSTTMNSSTVLAKQALPAGGGAFSFANLLPATTYYAGAFVDVGGGGAPVAGDDTGFFGSSVTGPTALFLRSGQALTGINFSVGSAVVSASSADVSGAVSYSGSQACPAANPACLRVEFWSNSSFTGAPVGVRLLTGAGAYDVPVPAGAGYYLRAFLDLGGSGVFAANDPFGFYTVHNQGADLLFVSASTANINVTLTDPGQASGAAGASGDGTASLSQSSQSAGSIFSPTLTYTVGQSSIQVGGTFGFIMPPGFAAPQSVSVSYAGGNATLSSVTIQGVSAFVTVTSTSGPGGAPSGQRGITPGQTVTFTLNNTVAPCALSISTFIVAASQNLSAAPRPLLAGSPGLLVTTGASTAFAPTVPFFSVTQYQLSQAQTLQAYDACGNQAQVGASGATVRLIGGTFNQSLTVFGSTAAFHDDPTVVVATTTLLVNPTDYADVAFAAGQSSQTFYVESLSSGTKTIALISGATSFFGFTALPANALTSVSVSTVAFGFGQTGAVINPNGDPSAPNLAYINFTLGNPNINWHVLVSSLPFKSGIVPTPVWDLFGSGQPSTGTVAWDGRFSQALGGARVPNGVYYVRIELAAQVHDDSLVVTVLTPQISGKAADAGTTPAQPLSNVTIQLFGPFGNGSFATDASGNYALPGLATGTYQLQLSRQDYLTAQASVTINAAGLLSGYATPGNLSISTNASGGLDFFMQRAPTLFVFPNAPQGSLGVGLSTQTQALFGTLTINLSTGCGAPVIASSGAYSAPLRLAPGTTVFDDGGLWDPTLQQNVAHTFFKFQVAAGTYAVTASLPGFSPVCFSQFVGAGSAEVDVSSSFFTVQKSSVSGLVSFASNPNGALVSVTALPFPASSTGTPAFASVSLAPTVTSASYTLTNLSPGNYMLRASVAGSTDAVVGPVSVPLSVAGSPVNFPAFGAGAAISGKATITADTTGRSLQLTVSAWAPGALDLGSTVTYAAGGAAGTQIPYVISGLDAGTTYQIYENLSYGSGLNLDTTSQMPALVTAPGTANFTWSQSSGAVIGAVLLSAADFANVQSSGAVFASPRPDQVGRAIPITLSQSLRAAVCAAGAAFCPAASSSATYFAAQMLNTETEDLTFYYSTTGQSKKIRVSVVNGSTAAVLPVDLSGSTFSISGAIVDQVSTPTFNSASNIFYNAPDVPLLDGGGNPVSPSLLSGLTVGRSTATLARVVAVSQSISAFTTAISTSFDPATSRAGYLTSSGTFVIANVPPGVYFVRTEGLSACAGCPVVVPSVGQLVHVSNSGAAGVNLTLNDGFAVGGQIALDQGILDNDVFTLTVTDHRQQVVTSSTVFMGNATLGINANAVAYAFANLPAGDFYTLTVKGTHYAGSPIRFPDPSLSPNGLQTSLTNQNVLMERAAFVVGRLQDAASGDLIGAANASLLAPNFAISAKADPWVEGGYVTAVSSVAGRPIQGDGYFHLGPLIPKVAYDLSLSQTNWDVAFQALGSQNYAPAALSGVTPQPGETRDVGVITLSQGQALSGTVCQSTTSVCGAGAALLGNIKVTAAPTFGSSPLLSQTFTNPQGRYTIWVSSAVSNEYDLTAAPADGNTASNGMTYAMSVRRAVNLATTTANDFALSPLPLAVTGQVVVVDSATGGDLRYPFGAQQGFPAAAVNLQSTGTVPTVNPLGDISAVTDAQGNFSVAVATVGAFNLKAASLGYQLCRATAVVSGSGSVSILGSGNPASDGCNILPGNVLQLLRAATVTGRILNGDGTVPSAAQVGGVAAANFNVSPPEYLVGSVSIDPNAQTVNSYSISGFKTGVSYALVILPKTQSAGVFAPAEGAAVTFAAAESSATKTIDLTYLSPSFDCQATAKDLHESSGTVGNTNTHWIDQFQIKVDCTKALRDKIDADNNLDKILSLSDVTAPWVSTQPIPASQTPQPNAAYLPSGAAYGQLLGSDKNLSGDRTELTAIYRVTVSTPNFSLALNACSGEVNPKTGSNFCLTKIFDFYELLKSHSAENVSNISGGLVKLVPTTPDENVAASTATDNTNNEQSSIAFAPGTFAVCTASSTDECDSGGDNKNDGVNASTSVAVGISKTTDPDTAKKKIKTDALGLAPALTALSRPGYVPARLAAAAASLGQCSVPGPNPLSSFYDIFLPATVRHQLRQAADLTLSFNIDISTWSQADRDSLHVWHFTGGSQKCPDGTTSAAGLCCDGSTPNCGYCKEDTNRRLDVANKTITVKVNSLSPFLVGTSPRVTAPATIQTSNIVAFNFPNPVDCIQHSNIPADTLAGFAPGAVHNFFGTRVRYTLPAGPTQDLTFNIYTIAGQLVAHSVAPRAGGGTYYDDWDCTNQTGHQVASGVYIGEFVWGGQRTFIKIAIIKGSGL